MTDTIGKEMIGLFVHACFKT